MSRFEKCEKQLFIERIQNIFHETVDLFTESCDITFSADKIYVGIGNSPEICLDMSGFKSPFEKYFLEVQESEDLDEYALCDHIERAIRGGYSTIYILPRLEIPNREVRLLLSIPKHMLSDDEIKTLLYAYDNLDEKSDDESQQLLGQIQDFITPLDVQRVGRPVLYLLKKKEA